MAHDRGIMRDATGTADARLLVKALTLSDLRPRLRGKTRTRARVRRARTASSPNGIRTRVSTLRGWCPRPLDDGARHPFGPSQTIRSVEISDRDRSLIGSMRRDEPEPHRRWGSEKKLARGGGLE